MSAWRAVAAFALVAWGALAFGAVYPWAFTPLFIGCAALGLLLWLRPARIDAQVPLAAALAALVCAIALQLVPLPATLLQRLTPATDALLRQLAAGYPDIVSAHPLSINPPETVVGLAAAVALGLLLLGLSRGLGRHDVRALVKLIAGLGVVMSLAGVIQDATWNGKIYGFWTPVFPSQAFGPFVNRNHFAGWMLMALPLVFAYFCGRVSRDLEGVRPGFRGRFLWFSSAEASETILIGFAVVVMAVGLVMTQSRSGLLGILAAAAIAGVVIARGRMAARRRILAWVAGAVLLFAVIGSTGLERLGSRFAAADVATLGNRAGVWRDSWTIVRQFPLTGTGLNTFGDASLVYQTSHFDVHFAEAHNDYLQLMAEGGVLLCLPALLVAFAVARSVRRRFREVPPGSTDYWVRVGAVTGILAVALQSVVEFSLQMPGNAVLFVVLLALAVRGTSAGSAGGSRVASADMLSVQQEGLP